jgi:hypothetical protein
MVVSSNLNLLCGSGSIRAAGFGFFAAGAD